MCTVIWINPFRSLKNIILGGLIHYLSEKYLLIDGVIILNKI